MGFILHNVSGGVQRSFKVTLQTMKLVTCDDIITLHAQIDGFPGTAKFLWEQQTGIPVEWLEPVNQQSVTYKQTLIRDDKIFSFFVNKGTVLEQEYRITVTAIPREIMDTTYVGESWTVPYVLSDLPTQSLSIAPVVAEGTAKFLTMDDPVDAPMLTINATRDVANIVYITNAYGIRKELTGSTGTLKSGTNKPVKVFGPWPRNYTIYVEQSYHIPNTDQPAWTIRHPVTDLLDIPPALSATDGTFINPAVGWGSMPLEISNFLRIQSYTFSEEVGAVYPTWASHSEVSNFLTLTSRETADETSALTSVGWGNHFILATNFVDRSSVGG